MRRARIGAGGEVAVCERAPVRQGDGQIVGAGIREPEDDFLRPLPQDCSDLLVYLASFETYLLLFVLFGLLFTINFKSLYRNPYAVFCILYSLSTLFLIGLIKRA